jgi:hypothetical protein
VLSSLSTLSLSRTQVRRFVPSIAIAASERRQSGTKLGAETQHGAEEAEDWRHERKKERGGR